MRPERLFAKSADRDGYRLTLPEHTEDVLGAAEVLLEMTAERQLAALGFHPDAWLGRFRRDLLLTAVLHDLGKANSYFQGMVTGAPNIVQPLRHEAVSYWIARRPEMQDWLLAQVDEPLEAELVRWAVAGHHRKFPPGAARALPMDVYLDHEDLRATLSVGAGRLRTPSPPNMKDITLSFMPAIKSVLREFEDAQAEADDLRKSTQQTKPLLLQYVALLKASLIAADVAGSIRRRGRQSIGEWVRDAFQNASSAQDLHGVVAKKLGSAELRQFQRDVGDAHERVVFVRAGCGSGKTLAAYHWAAQRAKALRRNWRVFLLSDDGHGD